MMAFKHVVTQRNGKKFRVTQINFTRMARFGEKWAMLLKLVKIQLLKTLSAAHYKNRISFDAAFTFSSSF